MDASHDIALAFETKKHFPPLLLGSTYCILSWPMLVAVRKEKKMYMISILCVKYLFVSLLFFIYGGVTFLHNMTLGGITGWTVSDKCVNKYVSS